MRLGQPLSVLQRLKCLNNQESALPDSIAVIDSHYLVDKVASLMARAYFAERLQCVVMELDTQITLMRINNSLLLKVSE